MTILPTKRLGLLALTAATSVLILAGCSAGGNGGGGQIDPYDPGGSSGAAKEGTSIDEPGFETAACPDALVKAHVADDTRQVDGTAVDAIAAGGMNWAPSCAFETTDKSGKVTDLVFYIADDTATVLKYIEDSYTANKVDAGSTPDSWTVDKATVEAKVGSAANDAQNNPLVGAAYVLVTVSS